MPQRKLPIDKIYNMDCLEGNGYEDIKIIIDAVHQAYIKATTSMFKQIK